MNDKIFLICSERSGSNLMTKIFNAHPRVAGPSPAHLFRAFLPLEHSAYYADTTNVINDVGELWNLKMSDWLYRWNAADFSDCKTMTQVLDRVYVLECKLRKKNISFIKEVKTYRLFEKLIHHYPESKFVYSVRDPRDMALSWSRDPVLRGDIVRASNIWYEDQLSSLKLLLRHPDKIAFVRYEQLLTTPETSLKGLCRTLEIPYVDEMLSFASKNEESKQAETVSWRNLSKPLIKNNFHKFESSLRADQIEYIEHKCCDLMEIFGYELATKKSDWQNLSELEAKLRLEERNEKPEYQSVSAIEREKRKNWMEIFRTITSHV